MSPSALYAVCPMDQIPVGGALPFDLGEIDHEGRARPLHIIILRPSPTHYLCYANSCPHQGVWLNVGSGQFFDQTRQSLRCGKHGALFDVESGVCSEGPCQGARLRAIPAIAFHGDVCISGVSLVEQDDSPPDEPFETMEITISPE